MTKTTTRMKFRIAPTDRVITVPGRCAWALRCLIVAGEKGCTPIDHPGPRWSAYVHKLKNVHEVLIETKHEAHEGDYPGSHARYILRSQVEVVNDGDGRSV